MELGVAERRRYTEQFQSQGFCVVRGLFQPAEIAQIASAFERIRGCDSRSILGISPAIFG